MKWIIGSAVILCAIMAVRCNYPYIEIKAKCTMDEEKCDCMAQYINSELSYSDYQKFKNVLMSENVGEYIVLNLNRDDPVSRVLLNAPIICQPANR